MIVGIDASRANKSVRTGTEWYSYHLIQELKKIIPPNVTVRLYTREALSDGLAELPANWQSCVLNWPPKYLWTLLRLSWEMVVRPPDVLFIPAHGLPLVTPPNTVAAVHDVGFLRFPQLYKRRQVWYHRFFLHRSLKRCHAIITISQFTKHEIELLAGPVSVPISVIPLAHDDRRFFKGIQRSEQVRVQERYHLSKPYFFYIGRLEKKKNIIRLLEAYRVFAQHQATYDLVLVGPWGYGREECERLLAQPDLQGRVHCLSWIPEDDVPALVAGARALLFPTLYEGFGLPILQAMAVGTPVVTSRGGAHEEVAGTAAEFVDSSSTASIAAALQRMASDEDRWSELRRAGLARADLFRWQHTAEETWRVLKGVTR